MPKNESHNWVQMRLLERNQEDHDWHEKEQNE